MRTLFQILVPRWSFARGYCSNLPTVRQTYNGPVEGIEQTSLLGKKFYAFRGIPFAEPPITGIDPYTGEKVDRRFKAPEPLKRKWTKNLKVHNFADNCLPTTNFFPSITKKSEDCLYLNVYVPAGGTEHKTVLVWLFGGAFSEGEATEQLFGPDFLLAEDNVVVLIQYRIGIFGFMNLGFGEYTGNMGLKDQQVAFKWIYENIEHFSGNKNEILLFGQSAGAASVGFHMLNEQSRKYFNRAFLLSGSAFNSYVLSEHDHLERMQDFSNTRGTEQVVGYLRTADSKALANFCSMSGYGKTFTSPWVPTIESPSTDGAFLTKSPVEIYESSEAPVLDTMFSFTSQEYITFYTDLLRDTEPYIKQDLKGSEEILPFHGFTKQSFPIEYRQALEKLRTVYFSDLSNVDAVKNANTELLSDLNFRYGVLKNVIHQARVNNKDSEATKHKNTFLFRFSYNTELNFVKILQQLNYNGAVHGDDVCHFFCAQALNAFKLYDNLLSRKNDSNVAYTVRRMVKLITNFARTGNPSIENDVQFKASVSPSEILCNEITNEKNVRVTTNILEQLHYETWKEIEEIFHKCQNRRA